MLRELRIQVALVSLYGKCEHVAECDTVLGEVAVGGAAQGVWTQRQQAQGQERVCAHAATRSLTRTASHCKDINAAHDAWHSLVDAELKGNATVLAAMPNALQLARGGRLHEAQRCLFRFDVDSAA